MTSTTAAEIMGETESQALTDGFHLVIDALKLNDIKTIYDVYPAEQMLPQYIGKTFPNALYVAYEDTLDPNFVNNITKKIHQLTK